MTRKRFQLPMLLVVLLLGLAAGFAFTSAGRADQGTTGDNPPVTTTDTTTTDPGTTTDPATSTDATTTTAPDTTTAADPTTTAPAPTTTVGSNTAGSNGDTTSQGDSQASVGNTGPPPTTGATTTTPPPTAPCDTTQITCGNNAATQVAVVSQNCSASSSTPIITVNVTTVSGTPVNNFTIGNVTTCLNIANITQVVQQFCVGCSIVVIPPPDPVPAIVKAANPDAAPADPPDQTRAGYCMPQPVLRPDGTWGRFVNLVVGQPQRDPKWANAVLASYTPGVGYACADGSTAAGPDAPVFTLTVPASFVGQYVNLCIQPSDTTKKPTCHSIKIDDGATISIPVASNVAATVTSNPAVKDKSPKQIAAAASAYGDLNTSSHTGTHAKKTSEHPFLGSKMKEKK